VDVTSDELKQWIGILVYIGLFPSPSVLDYWCTGKEKPIHRMSSIMSLTRFQQLKRYLHISDPDDTSSSTFFFNKAEPLMTHVQEVSRRRWSPGRRVAVDEMMVMCHGRSSETVRMKNKPIGAGFQMWALCDSGYVYSFSLTQTETLGGTHRSTRVF
jgi:Transposase IS4